MKVIAHFSFLFIITGSQTKQLYGLILTQRRQLSGGISVSINPHPHAGQSSRNLIGMDFSPELIYSGDRR